MGGEVIDWVHERCLDWGVQYRRRELGGGRLDLSYVPKFIYRHDPKGMSEDALEVSSAVAQLRDTLGMELPYKALVVHTFFEGIPKAKYHAVGSGASQAYWRNLHSAHCFLAAYIKQPARQTA